MFSPHRREFFELSTAAAAGLSALNFGQAARIPNERIVLAVMGLRGRGKDHIHQFSQFDPVEIAHLIDPDESVVPAALRSLSDSQKKSPRIEKDVHRVLEDKHVTALTIAAPDHWHALATIWHWHWDFGSGEIGNNGIHVIDMARFLLDLDVPKSIAWSWGKYSPKPRIPQAL